MAGVLAWIMVLTGLTKASDLVGMDGMAAGGVRLFIIPPTGIMKAIGIMISTEEISPAMIGLCIRTTIFIETETELKRGMV